MHDPKKWGTAFKQDAVAIARPTRDILRLLGGLSGNLLGQSKPLIHANLKT
jgi:hypothetical protein